MYRIDSLHPDRLVCEACATIRAHEARCGVRIEGALAAGQVEASHQHGSER
jgi:hypothetical protein